MVIHACMCMLEFVGCIWLEKFVQNLKMYKDQIVLPWWRIYVKSVVDVTKLSFHDLNIKSLQEVLEIILIFVNWMHLRITLNWMLMLVIYLHDSRFELSDQQWLPYVMLVSVWWSFCFVSWVISCLSFIMLRFYFKVCFIYNYQYLSHSCFYLREYCK